MGRGESEKQFELDEIERVIDGAYLLSAQDLKEIEQVEFVRQLVARFEAGEQIKTLDDTEGAIPAMVNSVYQPWPEIDALVAAIKLHIFSTGQDYNDFYTRRAAAFGGLSPVALSDYEDTVYRTIVRQLGNGEQKLSTIGQRVRGKAHHEIVTTGAAEMYQDGERRMVARLFENIPATCCGSSEDEIRVVLKQMKDSVSHCYGNIPELNILSARHLGDLLSNWYEDEFDRATLIGLMTKEYWEDSIADLEGAHLPASPFHNRLRKIVGLAERE